MPAKFYADTHIARAVAVQARRRGVDIVRCEEVGMAEAKDSQHLEYATAQGRIMISADEDFPKLHAAWLASGKRHMGIIYVHPVRKDDIGALVDYLEFLHLAAEGGAADLEKDVYNQVIYF